MGTCADTMHFRTALRFLVLAAATGCLPADAGQERVTHYELIEGSYLVDDCLVCGRPTIMLPMRGSFDLVFLDANPLFTRYELRNVHFQAGTGYWEHRVEGSGQYQIGGEFALQQMMDLQVRIDDGYTNKACYFTNEHQPFDRTWPMIGITVAQTNGTLLQTYQLRICAAPLREIWFSTTAGFTAGKWQSPTNKISGGDLLSTN